MEQIVGHRFSLGERPMLDARNLRDRYLRMVEHYSPSADAEELSIQARVNRVSRLSHLARRWPIFFGAAAAGFAALLVSPEPALAQFTQQGPKLVGTLPVGSSAQGWSVALSADGDTAIVGGPFDNLVGAVWLYTRSGGVWTQQGNKLVGTGAVGTAQRNAEQGYSVALSADGNTAIAGGPFDNNGNGAAWVFVQPTEDDCKHGGWLNFPTPPGPFTNQGQCARYFASQP
jgi:hypothetical protein